MATDTRTFVCGTAQTAANFRAFIANTRASLVAAGAARTADTGQIDPTTATASASTNTSSGYEIWALNDSLQATAPVYLKLEYGTGSAGNSIVGMWITWGTGTDGAGNLTGQVTTRRQLSSNGNWSATTTVYSCFTGSTFTFWHATSASLGIGFSLHRTYNAAGAITNDGSIGLYWDQAVGRTVAALPRTGSIPSARGCSSTFGGLGSMPTSTPADIALGSVPWPFSGVWRYSLMMLYNITDITAGTPFTLTFLTASHTFIPLGLWTAGQSDLGASTNTALIVPWE